MCSRRGTVERLDTRRTIRLVVFDVNYLIAGGVGLVPAVGFGGGVVTLVVLGHGEGFEFGRVVVDGNHGVVVDELAVADFVANLAVDGSLLVKVVGIPVAFRFRAFVRHYTVTN